jgi:hypothetical protein
MRTAACIYVPSLLACSCAFRVCSQSGADSGIGEAQRFIQLSQAASDAVGRAVAAVEGLIRGSVASGLAKLSTQEKRLEVRARCCTVHLSSIMAKARDRLWSNAGSA